MKSLICAMILLLSSSIYSQTDLEKELQFAASYIVYLEKVNSLKETIISAQDVQIKNYQILDTQRRKLLTLKDQQQSLYRSITNKLSKFNTKKDGYEDWLIYAGFFVVGRYSR